ncbi:MAG: major Facilitator Superfamily protein [Herbaspirillum sp.]|jgi:D-galactonate transporter|nr:major Facilitator Superfamily protein [Herbaspirillum sp.]
MSSTLAVVAPTEHAVYKKIAWRLIPFLLLCYMLATIDRFNIGFAKLQFSQDLKLDDAVFGIAAGIFSIGYVLFEVPSNLLLERVGVRRTLLRIMVLWGMVTCLLMYAQSALHLYILRFLLGVAEAGFFPGILLYLTYWFPDRLRGRMTSLFVMAVPVGGIISGPLSGWVMAQFQGVGGFHGWQWLFLLEGAPAVLCGVVAYFYLSDNASSARWLNDEEKSRVLADLAADRQAQPAQGGTFRDALRDPKVYLLAFIYFAYFCSLNTILLWGPTVLKAVAGQTVSSIGWISGAISLVSTIGMVIVGYSSDKYLERRWHVALCGFTAAACFLLLPLAVGSLVLTVILLTIASIGIFSVLSLFWTIPSAYLNRSAAAGGLALISSIGSFGGAVSPAMIGAIKVRMGSLYIGLDVIAILLAVGMLTLLICIPAGKARDLSEILRAEPEFLS